jgi:hypothetical protein
MKQNSVRAAGLHVWRFKKDFLLKCGVFLCPYALTFAYMSFAGLVRFSALFAPLSSTFE